MATFIRSLETSSDYLQTDRITDGWNGYNDKYV